MTYTQYDQNLQRNKMFSQATESIINRILRISVDLFKALLKFIQEMFAQVMGK